MYIYIYIYTYISLSSLKSCQVTDCLVPLGAMPRLPPGKMRTGSTCVWSLGFSVTDDRRASS